MKDILKQILIVGCGGFSLEVVKYLKDYSDYNPGKIQILGFLDPNLNNVKNELQNFEHEVRIEVETRTNRRSCQRVTLTYACIYCTR